METLKILGDISFIIAFTAFGMIGGQKYKTLRRYIAPTLALLHDPAHFKSKRAFFKWLGLYSWFMFVYTIGYGHESKLSRFLPNDWQRRIFVGLLAGVPFCFFGMWYAPFFTISAYSFRAGGFKVSEKYDFLYEDLVRYGTVAYFITRLWGC